MGKYCIIDTFLLGIVVRMETSDYNVGEGQTTEVCVIVEGGSNIPITIGVTTSPVTAEGQILVSINVGGIIPI